MAFTWDEDQIRWYEEASEASSFHKDLASLIRPYLKGDDRVCDWGCGLGKLSLELAPYVASIDCLDSDPGVLKSLEEAAARLARDNIRTSLGRAEELERTCDVGLMVFFGTPVSLMMACIQRSRRLLIRIMNADREGAMRGRETVAHIEKALQEAAYPYERIEASLDFGQPFQSLEDARTYLELYEREGEGLDHRLDQLVKGSNARYPYYLPKKKDLVIFLIDSRQSEA